MHRRAVLAGLAATATAGFSSTSQASVPVPYDWSATPPFDDRQSFVDWMVKNRGEDPGYLGERFDRFLQLIAHHDVWDDRTKRAYLLVPRERFVTAANLDRTYQVHYLDIGYGVTITGPNTVGRMTNTIDPQAGERVLEVGTGSGYQSAYLANLTDQVFTIGTVNGVFQPVVINRKLRNLPEKGVFSFEPGAYFGVYMIDTLWYDTESGTP